MPTEARTLRRVKAPGPAIVPFPGLSLVPRASLSRELEFRPDLSWSKEATLTHAHAYCRLLARTHGSARPLPRGEFTPSPRRSRKPRAWPLPPAAMLEEDFEKTLKVLIVGNGKVGKSSMIRRFCTGTFTNTYKVRAPTNARTLTHSLKHSRLPTERSHKHAHTRASAQPRSLTRATSLARSRRRPPPPPADDRRGLPGEGPVLPGAGRGRADDALGHGGPGGVRNEHAKTHTNTHTHEHTNT